MAVNPLVNSAAARRVEKKNSKISSEQQRKKEKRKRDLANERAGDHLALVYWKGDGVKDKVRPDRTYYNAFTRNDIEFKKGDSVYCLPERSTEDMYLAQLESMFEDKEGKWIECCWFMTQKEVKQYTAQLPLGTIENELFLGTSVDVNDIASLEGLAPVYTHKEFTASKEQEQRHSKLNGSTTLGEAKKNNSFSEVPESEVRYFARKLFVPKSHVKFLPLQWEPRRGFFYDWKSKKKPVKIKQSIVRM